MWPYRYRFCILCSMTVLQCLFPFSALCACSCGLEDFLSTGLEPDGSVPDLVFEQLPFNHPLFIMYSSGTTGPPKCIVHSAGVGIITCPFRATGLSKFIVHLAGVGIDYNVPF